MATIAAWLTDCKRSHRGRIVWVEASRHDANRDLDFHPNDHELGLLNAIMSAGSLVAIPFTPYAADILGRRMGILTGVLIMILGVILQSVSISLGMFIAARFFLGFGVAIAHGSRWVRQQYLVLLTIEAHYSSLSSSTPRIDRFSPLYIIQLGILDQSLPRG
jgi:MFS family permease